MIKSKNIIIMQQQYCMTPRKEQVTTFRKVVRDSFSKKGFLGLDLEGESGRSISVRGNHKSKDA